MAIVYSAVKALIEHENKFLIIKQTLKEKTIWDLPGGRINYGENPYESLHREIEEETGLKVDIIKLIGLWWFYRELDNDQVICNTFLCKLTNPSMKVNIENNSIDETINEYKWITKEEFLSPEYIFSHESLKELMKGY